MSFKIATYAFGISLLLLDRAAWGIESDASQHNTSPQSATRSAASLLNQYRAAKWKFKTVNCITLEKGQEHYVFHFGDDDNSRAEVLRVAGRFASNRELSFSWHDVAVVASQVRQERSKRNSWEPRRRR